MFKILHLDECPVSPMPQGRGEQIKLINASLGTEKLDLHFNRLFAGGVPGKRHHHSKADNVYIVKRGEGTLTQTTATAYICSNCKKVRTRSSLGLPRPPRPHARCP